MTSCSKEVFEKKFIWIKEIRLTKKSRLFPYVPAADPLERDWPWAFLWCAPSLVYRIRWNSCPLAAVVVRSEPLPTAGCCWQASSAWGVGSACFVILMIIIASFVCQTLCYYYVTNSLNSPESVLLLQLPLFSPHDGEMGRVIKKSCCNCCSFLPAKNTSILKSHMFSLPHPLLCTISLFQELHAGLACSPAAGSLLCQPSTKLHRA